MNSRPRLTTRLLPLVTLAVLVMQLLDPYRVWMMLLVGLGGAWLVAYLWARSLSRGLRLVRELRYGWAQVGDRLEERITIENKGWAPATWVEIIDQSTLPDHHINWVTGIGGNQTGQWQTESTCTRRGVYTIGPTNLRCGDPLGIYRVEVKDTASRTLVIMPPIVPLPAIEVAPGGRSGEGRPRPDAPERTVSAGSVREYYPGDSLRWIHWKTTARRQKPFVRIFDGTPAGDWRIILDLEQAIQAGHEEESTEEHGVILAASLADRGLRLRRAVGLAINGNPVTWLAPEQNEAQKWAILRALAVAKPGENSLSDLLQRMQHEIHAHTSIILITPCIRSDWLEALLPLIWRGVTPTVLLLDPPSFGSPESAQPMIAALTELGISHYLIQSDLLKRPEARPGKEGMLEWRVTPLGKAILVRKPSDTSWKTMT
ncbi:MAG: DUF58 domain-containing protein [Anaerolineales bacterium]|nr:DUF58 domain-containing protein [Anaerolineales bacterium]